MAKKNENNKQATSVKTNDAPAVVNKVVLKQHYESGKLCFLIFNGHDWL